MGKTTSKLEAPVPPMYPSPALHPGPDRHFAVDYTLTCEGKEATLENRRNCKKNPGHNKFIPISEFTINHLPSEYRDVDLYNWIKHLADRTVRVKVTKISENRPDINQFFLEERYYCEHPILHEEKKRENLTIWGSGLVYHIAEKSTESTEHTCPCPKCEQSSSPSQRWWEALIMTAARVVSVDEEARHATCDLFYDGGNPDQVRQLHGVRVRGSSFDDDRCMFVSVTCDQDLGTRLKEILRLRDHLWKKVNNKYLDYSPDSPHRLAVIVSHPHGGDKWVSVGEWTHREEVVGGWSQYKYNTDTCPGSSGAVVYSPGFSTSEYSALSHHHSHSSEGLNVSGLW